MNAIKTALLMAGMTGLFLAAGYLLGGQSGMIYALGLAAVMNFASYWFSDWVVLASQGARELRPEDAPDLFRSVERLATNDGIPMPRVYVVPGDQPNAFATGRNPRHAAVAVTQSIMELLSPAELEAVIGHELSHVRDRDILIGTIAATMAGAITILAHVAQWGLILGGYGRADGRGRGYNPLAAILMIVLSPLAALIVQMAVSRSREFEADASGARLSGRPLDLASALRKIEAYADQRPLPVNPSFAHLYIVNPLRLEGITALFRSHPPTAERIARLEAIAANMNQTRQEWTGAAA